MYMATHIKRKMKKRERDKVIEAALRFPEVGGLPCVGVGATKEGKPALYVYGRTEKSMRSLPDEFEGYPVIKVVVGRVRPLAEEKI